MDTCGEALVNAILCGMGEIRVRPRKLVNKNSSILEEACRLALITRYAGDHHIMFWKQRIDKALLNLLIGNIQDFSKEHVLLDKQISVAKEGLKTNHQLCVRGYVWDILGWLAIHSGENFNPCIHGSEIYINLIIICAW